MVVIRREHSAQRSPPGEAEAHSGSGARGTRARLTRRRLALGLVLALRACCMWDIQRTRALAPSTRRVYGGWHSCAMRSAYMRCTCVVCSLSISPTRGARAARHLLQAEGGWVKKWIRALVGAASEASAEALA